MAVKHFLRQITADANLSCRLMECNLYQTFLKCCEDMDILDGIFEMEEADGSACLLEQLHSAVGVEELIRKLQYAPHRPGDVLLLTGVGEAFPFTLTEIVDTSIVTYCGKNQWPARTLCFKLHLNPDSVFVVPNLVLYCNPKL